MQKAQLPAEQAVDRSDQKVRIFKESEDCQIADHTEHHRELRAPQDLSVVISGNIGGTVSLPRRVFVTAGAVSGQRFRIVLRRGQRGFPIRRLSQMPDHTPKHVIEHDRKRHDRDVFWLSPAVKKQAGG